jgi:hypothetical protein
MLHQVGDLFELNVKLRCQKVHESETSTLYATMQCLTYREQCAPALSGSVIGDAEASSDTIAVCSYNHTKHMNTYCGQSAVFLNAVAGGIRL